LYSSDPEKKFPVGLWLHRGNLFSEKIFKEIYWTTLKEIIEELWKNKIQTLWYAEGDWSHWTNYVKTLPEKSIIYHVDKEDIFEVYNKIGEKFCLSGGIPNDMLAFSQPDEIKEFCKKVIKKVAKYGGYILDAGGAIQQDAKIENVRALTEAVFEFGQY
jgi:uroporphyrinogen-III decarboxylase